MIHLTQALPAKNGCGFNLALEKKTLKKSEPVKSAMLFVGRKQSYTESKKPLTLSPSFFWTAVKTRHGCDDSTLLKDRAVLHRKLNIAV